LKIEKDLKRADDVAITHDSWTSISTKSYFTTTVHFIDDAWMLKHAVLGTIKFDGSHTGENISKELMGSKQKWRLPVPIAVTDNAANEQKAYELLEWTRFGCYGHRINLVVKNALKFPDVARILGKIRKLVTFFHQSTSMADLLFDKQKLLMEGSIIGHKLIMDVVTRWNSTLHMLKRILEQIPAVSAVANDPTITKIASSTLRNCLLTFDEQAVVEDLVTVLDPFDKATTIVCGENIPTLHKILPLVIKLTRISEEGNDDSPTIKRVKQQIRKEMGNRTEPERITLVACILNPYTKDLTFLNEMRDVAFKKLNEMIEEKGGDLPEVRVKKEKENDEPSVPPLPSLPSTSESEEIQPEVPPMTS
jgi:hypothetical protein